MVSPLFTQPELIEYLKDHGWEVVSDAYADQFDRLIFSKAGQTFPLQLRERYGFPMVVRLCMSLNIPAPEDHQRNYDQLEAGRRQWELEKRAKAAAKAKEGPSA